MISGSIYRKIHFQGSGILPDLLSFMGEFQLLQKNFQSLGRRACHDLAFTEVISYNRANPERVEQNEG